MKRLIISMGLLLAGLLLPSTAANAHEMAGMPGRGQDGRLADSAAPVGIQLHCSGKLCGHVYNDDDVYNLRISDNLGAWNTPQWPLTWHILMPGQNSVGIGVVDADALYVPAGCTATVAFVQQLGGPAWYKVLGGQQIHVTNLTGTCQVW